MFYLTFLYGIDSIFFVCKFLSSFSLSHIWYVVSIFFSVDYTTPKFISFYGQLLLSLNKFYFQKVLRSQLFPNSVL